MGSIPVRVTKLQNPEMTIIVVSGFFVRICRKAAQKTDLCHLRQRSVFYADKDQFLALIGNHSQNFKGLGALPEICGDIDVKAFARCTL